jgi:release factor glutamine methyltransferase
MAETAKCLGEILAAGATHLQARRIENPRLIMEMLAARLFGCPRLELPARHGYVPGEKHLAALRRGLGRVAAGEPVQYVVGETEFMGHRFRTDRRALIPRPETEGLVEKVLAADRLWRGKPAIVDVGTGTGCIVISLALARPDGFYIGLDTSADAVALARENAEALDVADRVALEAADLSDTIEPATLDAVVSNPPYVATGDYAGLPANVRDHEPRAALDGGPDGLEVVRTVVQDAAIVLKPGGFLFLEIGETQATTVSALLRDEGFGGVAVSRDLAGRDRVVSAELPGDAR